MTTTPDDEMTAYESVEKALNLLVLASRVDPRLRAAVGVVDDAVRSLRERNTRLGVLRHEAEAKVDAVRDLVKDLPDLLQTYAWSHEDGTWLGYAEFVGERITATLDAS